MGGSEVAEWLFLCENWGSCFGRCPYNEGLVCGVYIRAPDVWKLPKSTCV